MSLNELPYEFAFAAFPTDDRRPGQKIVSIGPILDNILSFSSPGTVLRMSRTCRIANQHARSYLGVAFDINVFLARYFDDPLSFRNLQARTATLISGPDALQFLDRTPYPELRGMLYLHVCPNNLPAVGYFLEQSGYQVEERFAKYTSETVFAGISIHFRKGPTEAGEKQIIRVIPNSTPFVNVLLSDWTCLVNVISFEAAYSLYPRPTFEDRVCLPLNSNPSHDISARPFVREGWQILDSPDAHRSLFPSSSRTIYDRYTWVITLKMDSIARPSRQTSMSVTPLSSNPPLSSCWRLAQSLMRPPLRLEYVLLEKSPLLAYTHVLSSSQLMHAAEQLLARLVMGRGQTFYDAELIEFIQKCHEKSDKTSDRIDYTSTILPILKELSPLPYD